MKITHMDGDAVISSDHWHLAHCTSGTVLRSACKGEGLAVSGTNLQRATRLVKAGLSRAQVEDRYGWKARRSG